jgi:hypothetical protein
VAYLGFACQQNAALFFIPVQFADFDTGKGILLLTDKQ